jgi:hypothetical protein
MAPADKKTPPLPEGALDDMAAAIEARARGPANDIKEPVIGPAVVACPNCMHSHQLAPKFFQCRRFPPVPLLYGFQPPTLAGKPPEPVINAVFPQMALDSFCGEFRHRDPKKAA